MPDDTLTIPPKTSLLSIERIWVGGTSNRAPMWAIWIATNANELAKPQAQRQGTYLLLNSNGSVDRVTVDGDTETVMRVMD